MIVAERSTVTLDPQVEEEVRADFNADDHSKGYPPGYVSTLLDLNTTMSRFHYLGSVIGTGALPPNSPIMISGYSLGSEMILARRFGFGPVYGVEVDPCLVRLCQKRLSYLEDMHPSYYDGSFLPYEDARFAVVTSGHVIEHTADPALYLRECMRVLVPGGYLSLEFPTRYHHTELHTGLPSLEWLPRLVRNTAIRLISSRISPLKAATKSRYRSIVDTRLQQISLGGVKRRLNRSGYGWSLLDHRVAFPGVVRCVIRKDA
jgi:ubiquinone/menaquinone biosynthesis C-methylase UbiE